MARKKQTRPAKSKQLTEAKVREHSTAWKKWANGLGWSREFSAHHEGKVLWARLYVSRAGGWSVECPDDPSYWTRGEAATPEEAKERVVAKAWELAREFFHVNEVPEEK